MDSEHETETESVCVSGCEPNCAMCGVALVDDGQLLCPSCFTDGQAVAPADGYQRYVDHDGTVLVRSNASRDISAQYAARKLRDRSSVSSGGNNEHSRQQSES